MTERLQRAVQQLEVTSKSAGKERIAARMSWITPTSPKTTDVLSVCDCVCVVGGGGGVTKNIIIISDIWTIKRN